MANGLFVTGTDTSVGKTVVSGVLIRALRMLDYNPCAMKPIETGALREGDALIPSDGMFLKDTARMSEKITEVTPYAIETPLCPLVASELDGVLLDRAKIIEQMTRLLMNYDTIVVEGVGGILTPVMQNYYVVDMALEMGLPIVVVTRPTLGTLNHTLLTVNYAQQRGLTVAGVVINFSRPPERNRAEESNPSVLKELLNVPIIGTIPNMLDFDNRTLDRAAAKHLNLTIIKNALEDAC